MSGRTMLASSRISKIGSDYSAALVGVDELDHLRWSWWPPGAAGYAARLDRHNCGTRLSAPIGDLGAKGGQGLVTQFTL